MYISSNISYVSIAYTSSVVMRRLLNVSIRRSPDAVPRFRYETYFPFQVGIFPFPAGAAFVSRFHSGPMLTKPLRILL